MPHQRPQRADETQASSGASSSQQAGPSSRPTMQQVFLGDLANDVKALNSSVLVLGQKMQYVVRNEKILGRNLLVLNKKIEEIQRLKPSESGGASAKEFREIKSELETIGAEESRLNRNLTELRDSLEQIKINYAKIEELKEMKYVIDAINPLEFVSVKQVDGLIDRKLAEALKKK